MTSDDPLSPAFVEEPAHAYRKLPGHTATLRGVKKLYLGNDHLLQIDTALFVERYRRFAYGDIQSLLLRRTARGWIVNVLLAIPVGLFGWLAFREENITDVVVFCGFVAFFGVLLIVNAVRGPTCRCQLETAIGVQPLRSLSRVRPARRALALLTERIVAAQGQFSPEDARGGVEALLTRR